jgi:hypothetical protein
MCTVLYCLCVNVYCTTVTRWHPIAVNRYIISLWIRWLTHSLTTSKNQHLSATACHCTRPTVSSVQFSTVPYSSQFAVYAVQNKAPCQAISAHKLFSSLLYVPLRYVNQEASLHAINAALHIHKAYVQHYKMNTHTHRILWYLLSSLLHAQHPTSVPCPRPD